MAVVCRPRIAVSSLMIAARALPWLESRSPIAWRYRLDHRPHFRSAEGTLRGLRGVPGGKPVVFMDYDSTPVGVDFRSYIQGVLDNCDILLAVIGPHWAGDDEQGNPRIFADNDWVRIEIETALKKNIPIVPV